MKHLVTARYNPHTEQVTIRERLFTRFFYTDAYRTEMIKLVSRLATHHESDCSISADGYLKVTSGDRHQYLDPIRAMFTEREKQPKRYWEMLFNDMGIFS